MCLTLIPQGLSYGQLANLPAINGLYAAIMPSTLYVIFGSSLQLAIGPVAVVSLLVGQLVANNAPICSYTAGGTCPAVIDATPAIDTAAQASLSVGIILVILSILNCGAFIQLISKPVIVGFTTGAAMTIGLSQLKDALGITFSTVPQPGSPGFDYNYELMEWYVKQWSDTNTLVSNGTTYTYNTFRNPYAIAVSVLTLNLVLLCGNDAYMNYRLLLVYLFP